MKARRRMPTTTTPCGGCGCSVPGAWLACGTPPSSCAGRSSEVRWPRVKHPSTSWRNCCPACLQFPTKVTAPYRSPAPVVRGVGMELVAGPWTAARRSARRAVGKSRALGRAASTDREDAGSRRRPHTRRLAADRRVVEGADQGANTTGTGPGAAAEELSSVRVGTPHRLPHIQRLRGRAPGNLGRSRPVPRSTGQPADSILPRCGRRCAAERSVRSRPCWCAEWPRRSTPRRAWIERARKRTVVRLRKEVEWAERETGKSWVGGVMPPPPGRLPSELDAVTEELIAARDPMIGEGSGTLVPRR